MNKFPRTPHLPGSKHTEDDIHTNYSYDGEVIATEKMDGTNIRMTRDGYYTRNNSPASNKWAYPLINYHHNIRHTIPSGVTILGEFMFHRKHISYDGLPSIYMMFGAVDGNRVMSWEETEELSQLVGIPLVRVMKRGKPNDVIRDCKSIVDNKIEGFVIRPSESFMVEDYGNVVAKFVGGHHNPVATGNGFNTFK